MKGSKPGTERQRLRILLIQMRKLKQVNLIEEREWNHGGERLGKGWKDGGERETG